MTKSSKSRDVNNNLIRKNVRELTFHPFSQFVVCRFNCQYTKDSEFFNHAINDNFVDGTKLSYDCCLEFYELKFHSKTGRPQRTSVCKQIYHVARRSVNLIPMSYFICLMIL